MDSSITLLLVLAGLILMSAYFSATETAFSSLNRIRIKNLANGGNKRAKAVMELSDNYDQLLSTILVGNNIVNIASASLATVVFVRYFGDAGVTISTVAMTILVLIFGEISPKSLAKECPEAFAMCSAPVLRIFIFIFTPLNLFFMQWKRLLSRLFQVSESRGITQEELITIVGEAEQEGGLDAQKGQLIRSAIEFNDLEVTDVLTPRIDVVAVSDQFSKEKILEIFMESAYSRLLVYHETIDQVVGIINQKDFVSQVLHNSHSVESIIKPPMFVNQSMKISRLLKRLQAEKAHMAVVSDEYGGTLGIVTIEDIIEELVGEIWDEHDEVMYDFEKVSETGCRISCNASLDKMFQYFHMNHKLDITTVSGWVVKELDRIPKEGDCFDYENQIGRAHV